jgi:hypothetical protein
MSENIAKDVMCKPTQSKEVAVIQEKTRYRLMKAVSVFVAAALCSVSSLARAEEPSERVQSAAKVFKELAADKENGLPINVLNKSVCVVILPNVKKAGLVVGAQYGRGVMNCRSGEKFDGPWGAPIMMRSSCGSFNDRHHASPDAVLLPREGRVWRCLPFRNFFGPR